MFQRGNNFRMTGKIAVNRSALPVDQSLGKDVKVVTTFRNDNLNYCVTAIVIGSR